MIAHRHFTEPADLAALRKLQAACDRIRRQRSIGAPHAIIAHYPVTEGALIVIADGFGGASARQFLGAYPTEFITTHARNFDAEDHAIDFAAEIHAGKMQWTTDDKLLKPAGLAGALVAPAYFDLVEKLEEAVAAFPQFDAAGPEEHADVDGGDLVEWFGEWRTGAKYLVTRANGGAL